MYEGLSN